MNDEVEHLLLQNDLISEGQRPNGGHQYVLDCWNPECKKKKKLYVNADQESDKYGLWQCKVCGTSGNLTDLRRQFEPPSRRDRLFKAAHELFIRTLLKNDVALDYLGDRGFTENDIAQFGYGFADESYVDTLLSYKFTEDELLEYGLLRENSKGEIAPTFWNHVIIPFQRGGKYETFQGRNIDPNSKVRYMNIPDVPMPLYHSEDLYKVSGRVWLSEGAFKRDILVAEGELATAITGTAQFGRFIEDLDRCEDLWIVLDADTNNAGQNAAEQIAQSLRRCHVVTLPIPDGEKKIGVDDYVLEHGIEALYEISKRAVLYVDGEPQKTRNLGLIVEGITDNFYETVGRLGYDVGHKRLMSLTEGPQRGSYSLVAAAPHMGKSMLLRDLTQRLHDKNEHLILDYYSHDDSLKLTIAHWIAQIGSLNSSDVRHPQVAYKDNPDMLRDWKKAIKRLKSMQDRMQILDSSYKVTLDQMYEDLCRWREQNPDGDRMLIIDGFSNTHFAEEQDIRDPGMVAIRRSSLMKRIAQEADIPVISTCEVPKLHGKRPNSWDLRDSGQIEYDVDVLYTVYQEAQAKGSIDLTDMKINMHYSDNVMECIPIVEVRIAKDKMNGSTGHFVLMAFHKDISTYEELEPSDQLAFIKQIYESESKGGKGRAKSE